MPRHLPITGSTRVVGIIGDPVAHSRSPAMHNAAYAALGVSPFESLDRDGVGALVRIAVDKGKATRPGIHLGICGEHGGDPASISFCESVGLDYVSCSPFRVPIARLAAAQAAVKGEKPGGTA
jgi:phosphoenolpyruvate synthase/pyruvate phosphate dikinase